jgi:hypothetical protein
MWRFAPAAFYSAALGWAGIWFEERMNTFMRKSLNLIHLTPTNPPTHQPTNPPTHQPQKLANAHSITSAQAGVNIVVMPGVYTYTLIVHQAGRLKWVCAYECDPFSMGHTGYMQGYITAS